MGPKIGLLAGKSQFPLLFARAARENGVRVFAAAHEGETLPELEGLVEEILWVKLGQLKRIIKFFQAHDLDQAVMAGGLTKTKMFTRFRPDLRALAMMARVRDRHDDSFLRAVAEEFEKEGIIIQPSTLYTPQLLAREGVLTWRGPDEEEAADIEFGWQTAKALGRLDIGQCVVVRHRTVLAVEAIEGTDETIRRGGRLGRERTTVVKVSKPNQDLRFDVPAVGPQTVAVMAEVKASALAVEADKTLIFEAEALVRAADQAGMTVVARRGD